MHVRRVLWVCFGAPIWSPLVRRESVPAESDDTQVHALASRCWEVEGLESSHDAIKSQVLYRLS
jgi:hypothetical protein